MDIVFVDIAFVCDGNWLDIASVIQSLIGHCFCDFVVLLFGDCFALVLLFGPRFWFEFQKVLW